jgi:MOSC domain-containing protein YiiM
VLRRVYRDDGLVTLDQLLPEGGKIGYADARRNGITRGIDLNALVGRRFPVGDVECLGQRLCEPCAHLERLTTKGLLRELIHRGVGYAPTC